MAERNFEGCLIVFLPRKYRDLRDDRDSRDMKKHADPAFGSLESLLSLSFVKRISEAVLGLLLLVAQAVHAVPVRISVELSGSKATGSPLSGAVFRRPGNRIRPANGAGGRAVPWSGSSNSRKSPTFPRSGSTIPRFSSSIPRSGPTF